MKNVPADVLAILATRQFFLVDLFDFTLVDGTSLQYCSGDIDIAGYSCGGTTGPYFKRDGDNSTMVWETGLQVSTLEFSVSPGSAQVNGVDFSTAVTIGMFDYAEFALHRAVMSTYGDTSAGLIPYVFTGLVGPLSGGRGSGERFRINSYNDLLNIQIPRNLYQAPCVNTLYDGACTLSKAAFKVTGAVSSGSTVGSINTTLSQATGYFDLGSVKFTSGANNGAVRAVKAYTLGSPSVFTIMPPLPTAPAAADTYDIYPGCDKTMTTCVNKFSNLANFRGFPGIPVPETAV